jgi:hypothetical protein
MPRTERSKEDNHRWRQKLRRNVNEAELSNQQRKMTRRSGNRRVAIGTCVLVCAIFLLFLLVVGVVAGLLWYKPAPREVALAGDSRDLGRIYGGKLRLPMRLVTRFYLDRVVCEGHPKLIESSRAAALQSLSNWPVQYREELNATATAAQLPVSAVAFGNAFLDLGRARMGCRSLVISGSNLVFHAHNLDWDNLGGLGRWATCIVWRNPTDGRSATVSVGFPGMIGALDIINEKGLALSFNQLGWGNGGTNEPVFIMVRRIAETCDSLEAARTNLFGARDGMPFIITVSDARAGKGSVFERVRGRVTERPLRGGFVAACNLAQGTNFGTTKLDQFLNKSTVADVEGVRRILSEPGILMECNIYSVVFDYHHNRLWLASGDLPAARGRYREYRLFR